MEPASANDTEPASAHNMLIRIIEEQKNKEDKKRHLEKQPL